MSLKYEKWSFRMLVYAFEIQQNEAIECSCLPLYLIKYKNYITCTLKRSDTTGLFREMSHSWQPRSFDHLWSIPGVRVLTGGTTWARRVPNDHGCLQISAWVDSYRENNTKLNHYEAYVQRLLCALRRLLARNLWTEWHDRWMRSIRILNLATALWAYRKRDSL